MAVTGVAPACSECKGSISDYVAAVDVAKRAIAKRAPPVAKRAAARESVMRPHKSRRTVYQVSCEDPLERLESTDSLVQRLRFVSPIADDAINDPDSPDARLEELVEQMESLGIKSPSSSQVATSGATQRQKLLPMQDQEAETSQLSNNFVCRPEAEEPMDAWRLCVQADSFKGDIHTVEEDGWQLVEEYRERVPSRSSISVSSHRGDDETSVLVPPGRGVDECSHVIAPSKNSPVLLREDTLDRFQWRVQNIPYAASTYSITVDVAARQIVIKTSNRKYYKRIDVPELNSCGLRLSDEHLAWQHHQNDLIVSYVKPSSLGK